MSRTVTALYDSRAEAETARGRLVSAIKTQSTRIIAKDTAAAVDGLDLDPKQADAHRSAIRQGGHLLVADIAPGQDPRRVIAVLEQAVGAEPEPAAPDAPAVGVTTRVEEPPETPAPQPAVQPKIEQPQPATAETEQPAERIVEEARIPRVEEELRIEARQVSRGGARVRSVVRETPAEEQVALSEERVDLEHRPSERRLSIEEVKAGGLLRERVFEIREMREEPVITKEAFVREEVIVRKTVQQRTATISDTVRRTEVEVEELPARAEPARTEHTGPEPRRGFFGGRSGRK
jgi:stress response protein YsnF